MNEIAKNDNRPAVRKPDPREVLDAKKRTKICGLLTLGYSQRMAAEFVGCDPSTITRTAKRDENFRAQLAAAQSDADISALKIIRRTADQERYWRAAAWILERRNPEEYGRRSPNSFTGEQVMQILQRALDVIMPAVPMEQVAEVMREFEEEFGDVVEKARLPLPEYEPEGEDEEGAPTPAERVDPPRIADRPQAAISPPPPMPMPLAPQEPALRGSTPPGQGTVPRADRLPPKMAAVLAETGKRTSCLEQFVERRPKAAATANGT
jgi:hypothetical protein